MQFDGDLRSVLQIDSSGFCVLTSKDLPRNFTYMPQSGKKPSRDEQFVRFLDCLGEASSKAQGLGSVITNFNRFSYSDHRLYVRFEQGRAIGFIKVGKKNLCYRDVRGKVLELSPLCVLDFYVHESVQRHGYGKVLFEEMVKRENLSPAKLAIDKPSFKFLSFLKKHYGLVKFLPQSNNFVIFDKFFEIQAQAPEKPRDQTANSKIGDLRGERTSNSMQVR